MPQMDQAEPFLSHSGQNGAIGRKLNEAKGFDRANKCADLFRSATL